MKHRRKTTLVLALVLASATALPGCASTHRGAATGAAVGGLLGAGGGYAIGHHRGNRTNWALGLGAVGALAGWLVGDVVDDRRAAANAGLPAPAPVVGCPPPGDQGVIVRERWVGPCGDPLPPGW